MIPVTIKYQPISFLKYFRFIERSFPSEWSELSPVQLIAVACLLRESISDISFLSKMTGFKPRFLHKLGLFQRFQLMELFSQFNSKVPFHQFILAKLDCKGTVLLAPKPKLSGVSFGQFIYMDTYFNQYQDKC